jgi:hypothetical protein
VTYSVSNLSRRLDKMFAEVERRKRPKLIYCSAEVAAFLNELEQQAESEDQEQSGELLTPELEQELNDAVDDAVRWTEQTFNVRFVE